MAAPVAGPATGLSNAHCPGAGAAAPRQGAYLVSPDLADRWGTGDRHQSAFVDERTPWTDEEEQVLRSHFYQGSIEQLQQLLPNRTWIAISTHACRLGLKVT